MNTFHRSCGSLSYQRMTLVHKTLSEWPNGVNSARQNASGYPSSQIYSLVRIQPSEKLMKGAQEVGEYCLSDSKTSVNDLVE